MESSQYLSDIMPIVTVAGVLLAMLLVLKIFNAKTFWAFTVRWGLTALIAIGWLIYFTDTYLMQYEVRTPSPLEEALPAPSTIPIPLLISLVLAAAIWLGGINWVVMRQRRKAGRSWTEILNTFNPQFRDMDMRAFVQIAMLVVLGFVVVSVGVELSAPAQF